MIYMSEEGFDTTYSDGGSWGKANYFAFNASYSNAFAHTLQDGTKQMFVANVIAGRPASLPSDDKLRRPPMIKGSNIPHDSVFGKTKGCYVIMVY
jgi:hypothetical protein